MSRAKPVRAATGLTDREIGRGTRWRGLAFRARKGGSDQRAMNRTLFEHHFPFVGLVFFLLHNDDQVDACLLLGRLGCKRYFRLFDCLTALVSRKDGRL